MYPATESAISWVNNYPGEIGADLKEGLGSQNGVGILATEIVKTIKVVRISNTFIFIDIW